MAQMCHAADPPSTRSERLLRYSPCAGEPFVVEKPSDDSAPTVAQIGQRVDRILAPRSTLSRVSRARRHSRGRRSLRLMSASTTCRD